VDVLAVEALMDTHAHHALLDKLLIQTTSTYVFHIQFVINNLLDYQETTLIVQDVDLATSQVKFQITLKLLVFKDKDQVAHVLRATQLMDTPVFHAELDRLDHHQINNNALLLQPVPVNMLFKCQLIEPAVVDAETVTGQVNFQINSRPLVFQDKDQVVIALRNYLPTDGIVNNAQQVKFHQDSTTDSTTIII
jgi:hypothetical protein